MTDILDKPLAEDFYDYEGWVKSLMTHYVDNKKMLSRDALEMPIRVLATAIREFTYIDMNFPENVYILLKQAIDPMYEPDEYHRKIYTTLKNGAVEENEPALDVMAESLLNVRKLFEQNKEFYLLNFNKEMEGIKEERESERLQKFGNVVQLIVKVHVRQIARMIAERK